MAVKVLFKFGTQAQYDALSPKEEAALYWTLDTQRLYKGELLFAVGADASDVAAGLMSAEDKALLDALVSANPIQRIEDIEAVLPNKVDKALFSEEGRALIFNEIDGGGAKYEGTNGYDSFAGVNSDTETGIGAQLYDINRTTNTGSKLDVTANGIFYTTGEASAQSAVLRDVEANEIATKKDIQTISVPEYSLRKETDPGAYAAVYHLTKNGVDVGEAINIAKDQLLKSVEVKTCTEKDVPVEGLNVGDKYLDFTFIVEGGVESHSYIAIKDMVKPYSAGDGIIIGSDNSIAVDTEVIASVEYVDASITDTMNFIIQERDTERAARIAGDNLLTAEVAKKTTEHIVGPNGDSYNWNEQSGGGNRFIHNDGSEAFVGVNDGGTDGLMAQIYADIQKDGKWSGSRINVYNDKIYYTNQAAVDNGVSRNDASYEIATKNDVQGAVAVWTPIA